MARVARVRFKLDRRGVDQIFREPTMKVFLAELGEAVAARARILAPFLSGDLRNSIEVEVVFEAGRWICRVVARDFKGGWWEFGTEKRPAEPYLWPALLEVLAAARVTRGG